MTSYTTGCPGKRPFRVPGILTRCEDPQTPTCLNCAQLYAVEQEFHTAYPSIVPTLANYYDLFAGFINEKYKMHVSPSAVYAAVEKCKSEGAYGEGCDRCAAVHQRLERFYAINPISEYYYKMSCTGDCEE